MNDKRVSEKVLPTQRQIFIISDGKMVRQKLSYLHSQTSSQKYFSLVTQTNLWLYEIQMFLFNH